MLPEKLTEGHQHLLTSGATADVLVKVKGFTSLSIGRYFHVLEEWQVNGWTGQPVVEEWWPLPKVGTGNNMNSSTTTALPGSTISRDKLMEAFREALPTGAQEHCLTYTTGPYDITEPTVFLVALAEILTGKKVEPK